jgi:hypothetical protein
MGWVLVLCPALLIAGIALVITPKTQGVWEAYLPTVLILSILPALFIVPLGLLWCLMIWIIYADDLPKKRRTLGALLPALLMLAWGAWCCLTDPPSPQKFFARHFHAPLPASAHDIKAQPISGADPGTYLFFFRCTPADTTNLVQELGAESADGLAETGIAILFHLPGAPDLRSWPVVRYFRKSDKRAGYTVATNTKLDEVFVSRDPLLADDDDELQ